MPLAANNRKDVFAKVTGRALYTGDIRLPGMMHAQVVRSPISSGRILAIRAEKARSMPGVLAVFTAADLPGVANMPRERPVLCAETVRYIGDGVALVVAESRCQAEAAARLVEVDYEETPALLDPRKALAPDAPQVHESGNLICRYVTKRGNAEAALKTAKHVLHREYSTQRVQHVCLETETAVAQYDPCTGETTLHAPVNSPFVIRKVVADTLGCPLTDVRVVLPAIGGSFGGKNYDMAMAASRAALASRKLGGRPCKMVLTREESITEGTKRHPLLADYTVGFDDDGKISAMKIDLLLDGGAYTSKTFPVTSRMAIEATGPYVVPNVDTVSTSVYTHHVYSDALRGFGSPQVDFCSECLMDEIADYLGQDPLEVRQRNMLREGSVSAFGQTMRDVSLSDCWQALDKAVDISEKQRRAEAYNQKGGPLKKGVGIAFLHRGESFGAAGQGIDVAEGALSIQADGSALIHSSMAEVGQGSNGVLLAMVHEYFGIPLEKIRISRVDTSTSPDAGPTVATRGTVFSGGAVLDAAGQLAQKLAQYAEPHLGSGEILFQDGFVCSAQDPKKRLPFTELVKEVYANSDHLNAYGHFCAPALEYDKSCGVGDAYWSFVYGAAAAEVTVDTQTGTVSVDNYTAVHDVGHAFNIEEVKGQMMGGISMGLGYALLEEVEVSAGRVKNLNFENYLIPTALDMPEMQTIALEHPSSVGPLGAKGLGEPATCAVAPAIVNAIHQACGRRVRALPANLEQVALGKTLHK